MKLPTIDIITIQITGTRTIQDVGRSKDAMKIQRHHLDIPEDHRYLLIETIPQDQMRNNRFRLLVDQLHLDMILVDLFVMSI
jgi:hypothetical protein